MEMKIERESYMKADAEGKAKLLAKAYGLSAHQMWQHKQSGKWIISHAGVQSIAASEGILVTYSVVDASQNHAVILASVDSGQSTFGEASPANCKMPYPFAMAEKRAYDRAVLIHALRHVGGYGGDFYGEDEADSFARPDDGKKAKSAEPAKKVSISFEQARDALKSVTTAANLTKLKNSMKDMEIDGVQRDTLRDLYIDAQNRIKESEKA